VCNGALLWRALQQTKFVLRVEAIVKNTIMLEGRLQAIVHTAVAILTQHSNQSDSEKSGSGSGSCAWSVGAGLEESGGKENLALPLLVPITTPLWKVIRDCFCRDCFCRDCFFLPLAAPRVHSYSDA
jgi:hypothetical protein